ncbi:hypothetical protein ACSBR1_021897 [Camellia fascicularis]
MGIIITTRAVMLNSGVVASGFLSTNIDIPLFTSGTFVQWCGAARGIITCSIALFAIVILLFKWLKLLG